MINIAKKYFIYHNKLYIIKIFYSLLSIILKCNIYFTAFQKLQDKYTQPT